MATPDRTSLEARFSASIDAWNAQAEADQLQLTGGGDLEPEHVVELKTWLRENPQATMALCSYLAAEVVEREVELNETEVTRKDFAFQSGFAAFGYHASLMEVLELPDDEWAEDFFSPGFLATTVVIIADERATPEEATS